MQALERAIVATIAYYDVFDHPLTAVELWKWLIVDGDETLGDIRIVDVKQALESETLRAKLSVRHGFYFLTGRDEVVPTRMDRYRLAERKYRRAKKIIRRLRYIPFIKMIGICNTLAYNNSRPEADIDLFIVAAPGRVWQARFWVAGFLKLFGLRPTGTRTQDTLCASFFTDTKHLNLESLAIDDDIYLPYWVAQVVPVYDEGAYTTFTTANSWIRNRLPQAVPIEPPPRRAMERVRWLKWLLTLLTFWIPERVFKNTK